MKATGIVRRIDDLGRVVIPKEIRRTMRIREGDPLEIYTSNEGEVIFKKYSPIGELSESAAQVADIMHRLAGCPVAVFDRDHVVSVSGAAKKEWNARRVSPELEELMENRKQYFQKMEPIPSCRQRAWKRVPWHACRLLPQGTLPEQLPFWITGKAVPSTTVRKA